MKIKSVTPCGKGQTYDLEINHPLHQFYCNGLLTSNSHSICYTVVSFREYWLKTYFDPEFNIAVLNNTPRGKEKKGDSVIAGYITEILGKGYKVLPPGINDSEELFSLKSNTGIVWGLSWMKGMSELAIKKIVEEKSLV